MMILNPIAHSVYAMIQPDVAPFYLWSATTALVLLSVSISWTIRSASRKKVSVLKNQLETTQRSLLHAQEQADNANATKNAFLSNMSHEIRTPLGVVLGFSELLVSTEMTMEEKLNTVEAIKRNGNLLSNVINDILDLSKVESGRLTIDRLPTQMQEVIRDLHHLLAIEPDVKGLRLSIHPTGLLPAKFETDPLRLRQVLQNIVGNAIKFTPSGFVEVWIDYDTKSDGRLGFTVRDSGPGIASEKAQTLFSPFAQGDITATRKFGGTGLGLALSKKLAQAIGGDVTMLESRLGVGSTFRVTIDPGPRASLELIPSRKLESVFSPPLEVADTNAHLPDVKVLLVEDSLDNQALIGRILRAADVKVEIASNGREGVERAMTNEYDLVFMDLQMPVLDGYSALAELRAGGYLKPVVALTAHALKEEVKRCLESGFSAHLSKPIDRPLLFETLRTLVYGERRQKNDSFSSQVRGMSIGLKIGIKSGPSLETAATM